MNEYTITDRGTFLSVSEDVQDQVIIYKAGGDEADDPLLNPAHLLLGKDARNADTAQSFADWLVSPDGQAVITGFKKNGEQLYTGAPQEGE